MNKTTLSLAVVTLLALAVVYFGEAPERILGTSEALKNEDDNVPFAVVEGAVTTKFQANGELAYTFNAERLEHYRENEETLSTEQTPVYTLVDQPELVFYRGAEPWVVRAEDGRLNSEDQNIELWQNVVIQHTSDDGIGTTIDTASMRVDPVNRLASTEDPVTIRSDKILMQGVGMEADLANEKLRLHADVQGTYAPR